MPLTRGEDVGYNMERMAYEFTMLDRNTPVKCAISSAALVDLAGDRWKRHPTIEARSLSNFANRSKGWLLTYSARPRPRKEKSFVYSPSI
jgi:hypothetical protein